MKSEQARHVTSSKHEHEDADALPFILVKR